MPTLLEYFKNDFKDLSLDVDLGVRLQNIASGELQEVLSFKRAVKQGTNNSCRMFTFYIPEFADTYTLITDIIRRLEEHKKDVNGVDAIGGFANDVAIGIHKSCYSNRIYFYAETILTDEQLLLLDELCKQQEIYLTIRGANYVERRMSIEKPLAFISHDSRDKDLIAEKIATGLNSRLCFVWYDEYSLKVGQSLRESIEKGIKEAKKCVLILTTHFLNNPGWTKKEFNSIFTREMIFNERIILPVWFNVTKEQVYEYSPALADTVALIWPNPDLFKEDEYKAEVEKLISKIHTEITSQNS